MMRANRAPSHSASVLHVGESLMHETVGSLGGDKPVLPEEVELLFDRLQVSDAQISNRMCPVRLPDGTAQVWVLPEHAHDDQARALVLAISQLGLPLAQPSRQMVSPARLGEVNRGLRRQGPATSTLARAATTPKHVLVSLLDDLIVWALKSDASDIHLTIAARRRLADVAFTINGACVRPEVFAQLSTHIVQELLSVSWMTVEGGNGAVFDMTCEQQGRFERTIAGDVIAIRWASLVVQGGISVCWRLLNRACWHEPPSLDTLGYREAHNRRLRRATEGHGGLVVFAGLVGSGKSTSLAALMKLIPSTRKIITLEDPVEYVIAHALQCAVAGFSSQAAATQLTSKLKTIKRSAAHDVLIGELRDSLGAQAVVDLVLAGTNVYTTVHASSALQILTRLSSSLIGVPESLLAMPGFVKLLVYQVLLKQLCPACSMDAERWLVSGQSLPGLHRASRDVKTQWLKQLSQAVGHPWSSWRFRDMAGCHECRHADDAQSTGYRGRLLVAEMLEPAADPAFYRELSSTALWPTVARWQRLATEVDSPLEGYVPVAQVACGLVGQGLVDPREYVVRFTPPLKEAS
jgi:type II secretory ATPase GspE/PulE/Tfp pilus assembly ATPase PilB-like protein